MSTDIADKSGQPVTVSDIDEATAVVRKYLITAALTLPPELVVQFPNILRCLAELRKTHRAELL